MKWKTEAWALALVAVLAGQASAEPVEGMVTARTETAPIDGDADDPAIWAGPGKPRIIGTDKTAGLRVYDLSGALVQTLDDGELNNVDLRPFAQLGGVALVGATKREDDTLVFYTLGEDGLLSPADPFAFPAIFAGTGTPDDIYGFTMGADADGLFAVANYKTGEVFQWRIAVVGGRLTLRDGQQWRVPSQPEGMVFDDRSGLLYVGEEDAGIWRFDQAGEGAVVARVGDPCLPRDDVEGLAIHEGQGGARYLVASAQGIHRAAVFAIGVDGSLTCAGLAGIAAGVVDGVTETDGLAVTAAALPDYPEGLLVMMDDQNEGFSTNFKLISWADVRLALGL
jgi:3-phytase